MRKATHVLTLLASALACGVAAAVQEELLEGARKLFAEAKPYVEKANDVDLSMFERKAPRQEAFRRLKDARGLFDRYLDANPALEEKLDGEYVQLMVLLHGIKKDSALGELEKDEDAAAPPARPPAGATSPRRPTPPAAAAPATLAEVRKAEKSHPGDLPRTHKLYASFLARSTDASSPDVAEAADALGRVADRIKSVFRSVAKRDFDGLSGADSKDERAFAARVAADLESADAAKRLGAARLLASTRSRAATPHLARFVVAPDKELAEACRAGLLAIGGTSVGENLERLFRNRPEAEQRTALSLLAALAGKDPVEAGAQSRAIAGFTSQSDGPVAREAFRLLVSMGRQGGPGLWAAVLSTDDLDRKAAAMTRMAEAGYHRGAYLLASRFLVETKGDPAGAFLCRAAIDAIEKMGVRAVPHLADALEGASARLTSDLVSKMTGVPVAPGERQKVRDWWAAHKSKDAD